MTFDIKTEWTCPSINEVFLLTEDNMPRMKVKCVEGKVGEEYCTKCVWWDRCEKCDSIISAGPFPCEASQRPDGKYVYYIVEEVFNG